MTEKDEGRKTERAQRFLMWKRLSFMAKTIGLKACSEMSRICKDQWVIRLALLILILNAKYFNIGQYQEAEIVY